jgi:hypothetical protein
MKSDLRLEQDIFDELIWMPGAGARQLGEKVKNCAVTLTSRVDSQAVKAFVQQR